MPTSTVKNIKITGGDKYKAVLAKIAEQHVGVRVGILEGATTTDGEPIAPYAAANEFGSHAEFEGREVIIPSRPFLRQTAGKKQGEWIRDIEHVMRGNPDKGNEAMHVVGQIMRADIVAEIEGGDFAQNADITIKRKMDKGKEDPDHPLIDTGQMMEAVSYEVVKT